MDEAIERRARIAGQDFALRSTDVVRALRGVVPEPVARHYVVVDHRKFPPKQVISTVTGLDRADFTTHQARRTLMRLGFPAGRRGAVSSPRGPLIDVGAGEERLADRLRPHMGRWVAVKDDDVLYSAATPQRVVGWLTQHGQTADSMFRVPEDELASSGLSPL